MKKLTKKNLLVFMLALAAAMMMSCTGGGEGEETSGDGVDVSDSADTSAEDTSAEDTSAEDTAVEDTAGSDAAAGDLSDPLTLLNTVWEAHAEEERFAIAGGDYDNMVMDAPGEFSLATPDYLDSLLGYPTASADQVESAASVMHMMNGNNFTCGAFKLVDGADADALATTVKDNIQARQWMCGFPEKLLIAKTSDGVLVSAFGLNDVINNFSAKLASVDSGVVVLVDEAIEG